MATSLERSQKEGQISNLRPTIRWKFGENRFRESWYNLSERFIL